MFWLKMVNVECVTDFASQPDINLSFVVNGQVCYSSIELSFDWF